MTKSVCCQLLVLQSVDTCNYIPRMWLVKMSELVVCMGIILVAYSIHEQCKHWTSCLAKRKNMHNPKRCYLAGAGPMIIDVGTGGASQAMAWPLFLSCYFEVVTPTTNACNLVRLRSHSLRSPWSMYCCASGEMSSAVVAIRPDCPSAHHSKVTHSLHNHLITPILLPTPLQCLYWYSACSHHIYDKVCLLSVAGTSICRYM